MLRFIIRRSLTTCNKINSTNIASAVTNSNMLLDKLPDKKNIDDGDDDEQIVFFLYVSLSTSSKLLL